jgi:hypothetical protein
LLALVRGGEFAPNSRNNPPSYKTLGYVVLFTFKCNFCRESKI